MSQRSRRCLRWIVLGFIALTAVSLTSAPSALAQARRASSSRSHTGTAVTTDDHATKGSPATADPFQSLLAGVVDENIPPEALRLVRSSQGLAPTTHAQASRLDEEEEAPVPEYDPWVSFNEKTFGFNRQFDRLVLKPVATVWDKVLPDLMQESLGNFFTNLGTPRRLVNELLQGRGKAAGIELARFFVNISMGVLGFFDAATDLGLKSIEADTGQTFGVYGAGPGPYLVVPFLPPLTVRDGIGFVADILMDPLIYVVPFAGSAGRTGARIVNDRSLNLELFEQAEESALDLYTAVRNGYLARRQQLIQEALEK